MNESAAQQPPPNQPAWDDEVEFWDRQLSGLGEYSSLVLTRFDLSVPGWAYRDDFEDLIRRLGSALGRTARVLDLGSGPASVFAYGYRQGMFDLVAADPLAAEYLALIKKHGLRQTCPFVACAGEDLAAYFPEGYFDLVWSFNSIDHTQEPNRVLENIADVTRPDGIVVIQCWNNEGSKAAWTGLHKYDFQKAADGMLLFETQDGSRSLFSDDRLELITPRVEPLKYRPQDDGRTWLETWYRRR